MQVGEERGDIPKLIHLNHIALVNKERKEATTASSHRFMLKCLQPKASLLKGNITLLGL